MGVGALLPKDYCRELRESGAGAPPGKALRGGSGVGGKRQEELKAVGAENRTGHQPCGWTEQGLRETHTAFLTMGRTMSSGRWG